MIDSLVSCIIEAESAGKADAVSSVGAVGLMQIMPATWKEWAPIAGVSEDTPMTDPDANKKIGTAYIKFLLKRYDDNIPLALAAYNCRLDGCICANRCLAIPQNSIDFNTLIC